VDGNVEAGGFLQAIESCREGDDVFVIAREGAAEDADDADGVFVAGGCGAFRVGDVVGWSEGDVALLHIPVAREFVPADLGVGAHDEVRANGTGDVGWLALGLHLLTPTPLEGQAAEHASFAGADGGCPNGGFGRGSVPELSQHVDAAHFKLGGLRVFILVDHVLIEGFRHELVCFGLHPRAAEGGEIEAGAAVEDELVVDEVVGGGGRHAFFRNCVAGSGTKQRLARVHGAHKVIPVLFPRGVRKGGVVCHG